MRPSSARRLGNLRDLVVEFAGRDLGHSGVAVFLGCSLSAARNYVAELQDAGVVVSHPVRQGAGCLDRTLYRLTADPLEVRQFLAALAEPHGAAAPDPERVRHTWRDADFSLRAGSDPVRRDPLVAALFGAA